MNFFKYIFATVVGVVAGFFLCVLLAIGFVTYMISSVNNIAVKPTKSLSSNSFLVIDLDKEVKETRDEFSLFFGGRGRLTLKDYVEAIKIAEKDKTVDGIFLKLSGIEQGWSTLKTLRRSLQDFKKTKKPIFCYSDYLDEKSFYLGSVATKIFMHPEGEFSWDGLGASPTFYQGLFEKLGIKPIVFRVGKFKSAVEPFIQKQMSPSNKRQINELIDDIWQELISAVSKDREISEETLNEIAENLQVRTAEQAYEMKLIDELKLESEVFENLILKKDVSKIDKEDFKKLVKLETYWASKQGSVSLGDQFFGKNDFVSSKPTIATITLEGAIVSGSSEEGTVGSDDILAKILKAKYAKNVKGVVVRINSPGGSALASDIIWTELKRLREVKPVYASFGDVAASGGYYVGVAAEKIFADENTITGSIGVYSVLFNIEKGANEKLGFTFDRVVSHPYADRGSSVRPMLPQESTFFQEDTNRVYERFIEVVQLGREFDTYDSVHSIAQGRVWSGTQAKQIGLVDELGGFEDAVVSLASQLKLPKDFDVKEVPGSSEFEIIFGNFLSKMHLKNTLLSYLGLDPWAKVIKSPLHIDERIWALTPTFNIE